MPVYDYLQYGSGPPGSVGTQTFMMNWLDETSGIYTTPQGSGLYCTEQDCMTATGCGPYTCSPPPGGCPPGQNWVGMPTCSCQTPMGPRPIDPVIEPPSPKQIEPDTKKDLKDTLKEIFQRRAGIKK
tara:strand:- start:118 stop:498 length:381 start_codon:yes stop_codon:yes gene_type:complete